MMSNSQYTNQTNYESTDEALSMEKFPVFRRAIVTRRTNTNSNLKSIQLEGHEELKSLSMPTKQFKRASNGQATTTPPTATATTTTPSSSRNWIIESLPSLPDYPLEANGCITISSSSKSSNSSKNNVSNVTQRIEDYLKRHSIVAHYNPKSHHKTASAKCTTSCQMTFWIHLYQNTDTRDTNRSDGTDGTVTGDCDLTVEIQRWSNCGIAFRSIRNDLWKVAKGIYKETSSIDAVLPEQASSSRCTKRPRSQFMSALAPPLPSNLPPLDCIDTNDNDNDDNDDDTTTTTVARIEQALEELVQQSNHVMAQQNELQALQELSNLDITTSKTACRFATQILSHGPLTHYLCQRLRLRLDSGTNSNGDVMVVVDPIHYSILSLLYTCLWTLYNQNTLSKYIEQEYTFVSQELLVTLLYQSSQAVHTPHNAWLGTKGVNLLLTTSVGHNNNNKSDECLNDLKRQVSMELNGVDILNRAKDFGLGCHFGLVEEANITMGLMVR